MTATKTGTVKNPAQIFATGELKVSERASSVNCDCVAKETSPFPERRFNHEADDPNTHPFNLSGIDKTLLEAKSLPALYGVQLS